MPGRFSFWSALITAALWFGAAGATPVEDCTQGADIARAMAGCGQLIDAPGSTDQMRGWALTRRAAISGDPERAMADVNRSIQIDPKRAYSYLVRGRLWTVRNEYNRALADYNDGLRLDPKNVNALNSRAWLLQAMGNFDRSIDDYSEAIGINPKFVEAYLGRGRVMGEHKHDFTRALADFDAAIQIRPNDAFVLQSRGDMFQNQGDFGRAEADFNEAIRIDPKFAGSYNGRANIRWKQGQPDLALADIDQAIKLNPKNTIFYITRATILFEKRDLGGAIAAYNEAIRLNPKVAIAYNNRGFVWKDAHELNRAIVDFDEAIRLDPTYAKAWANRSEIWRMRGELDRALADQDQAIKVNPGDPYGYVTRGNTLRYMGSFPQALAAYDKALDLGQYSLAALTGKGLTYEKMGDLPRARVEFQKAIDSTSQFRADANRQALETARARLAAFDSGAVQPKIAPLPAKAGSTTSVPTQAVAIANVAQNDAAKERRVALVIGNSSYRNTSLLPNPTNDAKAVSKALRSVGFQTVNVAIDATRAQMTEALQKFAAQSAEADWAVVYYAGHGVEQNGTNYLIPVDAHVAKDTDIEASAVPLDDILASVDKAKRLKLIVLDACRNNPFLGQTRLSASIAPKASPKLASISPSAEIPAQTGLAPVKVSGAMLVVYAAKHGEQALDGDGEDSPFTVAFLQRIATPNVEINKLFRLVRDDVMEATAGRQEPYTYGSLPGREDFFFVAK